MEEVIVRTQVYVPPEEAFAFLREFSQYADYSEYLKEVRQYGDGNAGTQYDLRAEWWRIGYTARTEVTNIEEPERIEWRVLEAIDAYGVWTIEPQESGSIVRLRIAFDTDSADPSVVNLPRFVSVGWVIDRVKPLVTREAQDVVERVVADLEGEPRDVDLDITTRRATD